MRIVSAETPPSPGSLANVQPILDTLPAQLDAVRTRLQAGKYREAIQSGFRLGDNIQRAFGIAQSTRAVQPNELCGSWDQNRTGLYPNN